MTHIPSQDELQAGMAVEQNAPNAHAIELLKSDHRIIKGVFATRPLPDVELVYLSPADPLFVCQEE